MATKTLSRVLSVFQSTLGPNFGVRSLTESEISHEKKF